MNFSSFVSPFSLSTALNNQFSSKFAINGPILPPNEANGADNCSNLGDGDYLKPIADSMMAVSRHQNSAPRPNQPHFPDKYHRDNYLHPVTEDVPNHSMASGFPPSSSSVPSLSLLTSKLRTCGDNLSGISYGANSRNTLTKLEVQGKRTSGPAETMRLQNACGTGKKEEKESEMDLCPLVPATQPHGQSSQATNISVASWQQSIAAVAAAVAAGPTPTASTTAVADYLSHLPNSSLPISLHNLFKYSGENAAKKEGEIMDGTGNQQIPQHLQVRTKYFKKVRMKSQISSESF